MKPLIQQIWQNKGNGQLLITIPKDSGYKDGDYVENNTCFEGSKIRIIIKAVKAQK